MMWSKATMIPVAPRAIGSGRPLPMTSEATPAQALLAEAVDFLLAQGVPLTISSRGYEVDGAPVSEGEIVAKAFALGMAGAERLQ